MSGLVGVSEKRVHLIGIGGSGLSAIARVLLERGAVVSGSDLTMSPAAVALRRDGVLVSLGHAANNVNGADIVVVSSAVPEDNVEIQRARASGIPVVRRPEFLGQLMEGTRGIAVAGTHGKTTTTAMIASILLSAGRDPTFVVGGVLAGLNTNARAGNEPLFVVEADEYDRTFLSLRPEVAVITNVEHDHPDCYPTFDDCRAAFDTFIKLVPETGLLVLCWDDPVARQMAEREVGQTPVATFGLLEGAAWRAEEIRPNLAGGVDFLAVRNRTTLGLMRMRIPGAHNASNAMAALAVTDYLGVPLPTARQALTDFRGVARRFEIKGQADGVTVVDDYAHHPTEILATLKATKERFPDSRLWVVWQPHTHSRTKTLLEQFGASFGKADRVIILPIYEARETEVLGISIDDVLGVMVHDHVQAAASLEEALVWLGTEVRPGDVVLTLGAGDGYQVGEWLLQLLSP